MRIEIGSPKAKRIVKANKDLYQQDEREKSKRTYLIEIETISRQTHRVYALNVEEAKDLILAGEAEPVGRSSSTSNILWARLEEGH